MAFLPAPGDGAGQGRDHAKASQGSQSPRKEGNMRGRTRSSTTILLHTTCTAKEAR